MSRSNPSRADARRAVAALSGRGWRSACALLMPWWRTARLLSSRLWRTGAQTARLAIGIPDYDNYADHVRRHHPGREPMDRDAFFRERMDARYGKGRSRCC